MIIIMTELLKTIKLKKQNISNRPFVIAIDGRCACGKTTLATELSKELHCDIIHMDDFFLPPELRTKKRYSTPGGNVHFERFETEVIPNLKKNGSFSYRIFDCSVMSYGKQQKVCCQDYIIVEGSYSHSPLMSDYADMKIFVTASAETQRKRIELRNKEKAEMFFSKWIPLEEEYFKKLEIQEKADVIINT